MTSRIRNLTVKKVNLISSNMKRITFSGEDLFDFPENYESGYVKIRLPKSEKLLNTDSTKKSFETRSYTIRSFRPGDLELDIDFLLHGDSGPASKWANSAQTGEIISFAGPGPVKLASESADWYLFVGDMTALPAISVNLERLPEDARGLAILEINSMEDKLKLEKPENLKIQWILNSDPTKGCTKLIDSFKNTKWEGNNPFVWVAGEFDLMRCAKKILKNEKKLPNDSIYFSSYWKIGEEDKGMKKAKASFFLKELIKDKLNPFR